MDNGIVGPGASPDDTNGVLGLDGDQWRGGFTNPSFNGTCLEIKVHLRDKNDNPPGGFRVELFSDGSTSDGTRFNNSTGTFTTYTETYSIQKTAAQLANLEVSFRPDDASFDDRCSEIEVEIVLTSSSSSSFSSSSSCSSSFSSCSSSSCSSSFSSSSSSFSSSSESFSSSSSSQSSSSSCTSGAWETHFANDSTGWQCAVNCSSSPPWTVAGPGMAISEQGTWVEGYRPIKVRMSATHNLGTTWNLRLRDSDANIIAVCSVPQGGGTSPEVDIDWSNNLDIEDIIDPQAPTGQIYDIEFFVCGASFSSSSSSFSSSSSSCSSSSCSSSVSSSSSLSSSSSSQSFEALQGLYLYPNSDIFFDAQNIGAPVGGKSFTTYNRVNDGIFGPGIQSGGGPITSTRYRGDSGESYRCGFPTPVFQGTCLEIKVHIHGNANVAPGNVDVTLYSDGATSDGTWNLTQGGGYATNSYTWPVKKTAAQLANMELETVLNDTAWDRIAEIEIEIVLTSSSSSSFSSCSSSSCSSSFSSSSFSSSSFSSSSKSSISGGILHNINPNGDNTTNWLVLGAATRWQAINDWDDGSPAYLSDYMYGTSTAVGTEIIEFEDPSFGGTCTAIDVNLTWIGTSPFPTLGVSLYDGAVQIGTQQTDVGDGAWNPKTFTFVTSKTAAELSDLRVHFEYKSGSGTMAVAACQVEIKIDSESSSSSSSLSSCSSSCDSAFSSSSSSSSQSVSSSSSCPSGQWVQTFGLSYWVCLSNCNWDGDSYNTAGPGLAIRTVNNGWYTDFRPIKWRITVTAADSYTLRDTDGNVIASGAVTAGANEFDIDWSNDKDIGPSVSPQFWGRISNGAASDITNIEFFVCGSSSSSSFSSSSSCSSSFSSSSSSSFSSSSSSSCDSAFSSSSSSSCSSCSSSSSYSSSSYSLGAINWEDRTAPANWTIDCDFDPCQDTEENWYQVWNASKGRWEILIDFEVGVWMDSAGTWYQDLRPDFVRLTFWTACPSAPGCGFNVLERGGGTGYATVDKDESTVAIALTGQNEDGFRIIGTAWGYLYYLYKIEFGFAPALSSSSSSCSSSFSSSSSSSSSTST